MTRIERGLRRLMPHTERAARGAGLTLASAEGWPQEDGSSTETALKLSAVSGCVEIISNAISVLPAYVQESDTRRRRDDHRLGELLWRRPNEAMTIQQLRQMEEAMVLTCGDCFVWILRDGYGTPVELLPFPPGWCEIRQDPAGGWFYAATDPRSGRPYRLEIPDILHYKAFSLDGIHGMSVLRRARVAIETGQYMEQVQRSVYAHGGRPSGVLTVETDLSGSVEREQPDGTVAQVSRKDLIRQEWERFYSGPDNALRTAVLDQGMKYTPIGMTNADAQFVENKDLTVLDICRFFCVPPYKLGIGKQAYSSNEQNNLEFAAQTILPIVTDREQEETWKLLTLSEQRRERLRIRYNMDAILRADARTRADVANTYRTNGVYSVNDIRANEDLPAVPGGDTRLASLNYVPLERFDELSMARNAPDDKD